MGLDSFCNYYLCGLVLEFVTYTNLDDTVFEFLMKNKSKHSPTNFTNLHEIGTG